MLVRAAAGGDLDRISSLESQTECPQKGPKLAGHEHQTMGTCNVADIDELYSGGRLYRDCRLSYLGRI
jgi:hypothetical protein